MITDSGTAAVTTTYHYDGAGNRTGKDVVLGSGTAPAGVETGHWTYTYNTANQLTRSEKRTTPTGAIVAAGSYTYAYDANGNRTSRIVDGTTAVAARTTTYAWDAWDRLRETGLPTSATAKQYYRNTYDYRMRRIARAQTGGGLTTRHTAVTYSGGLSVAEFNRTSNTALAASASAAKQYVRGPDMGGGVGGLLYSYTLSDGVQTPKFNLSNGRGDIVAQTSAAGSITWTASYEAYGKQTKETGTNTDLQRANSKEEDPTGLLNEGHRYRDLDTGVWLSRDPAGFVDGPNLYAYVKQNPWTHWDPLGLEVPKNSKEARQKIKDINDTTDSLKKISKVAVDKFGSQEGDQALTTSARLNQALGYMLAELSVYQDYADKDGNLVNPASRVQAPILGFDADTTAARRFAGMRDAVSVGLRDMTVDYAETAMAVGGARSLVSLIEAGGSKMLSRLTTKNSSEIFYRSMSQGHYEQLVATGNLPATAETFISPTKAFAANYDGVLVQFNVRGGTTSALERIGVRHASNLTAQQYGGMPLVSKGWTSTSALFKAEGGQINIGLGRGAGLDTFNSNILKFQEIPK